MEKVLIKKEDRVLTDEHVADIARTIFNQLGGNAGMGFARVTGTKDFMRGEDAKHRPFLQFKLPSLTQYLPDQKVRPNICRGQLCQDFRKNKEDLNGFQAFLLDSLVLNSQTRPDFVAYKFADRDNLPLRLCTKLWGVQEVSWTIRDRDTMAEAEEDGCVVIFEKFDPEAQEDAGKTV